MERSARAAVTPVRQRTQYSCMSASMLMCLQACGHDVTEDEVNNVMGARPLKGAAWEDALACAQHFGCRATLTTPATIAQLKAWTDAGKAVMIAWNPEGRDWSHASTVYHVTDGPPEAMDSSQTLMGSGPGMYVWVADPNIPNPEKTTRIVHEDDFYAKWYEKWPQYLVRRPACCIEREVTPEGRQVLASTHGSKVVQDWLQQAPKADPKDLADLETTARKGPGWSRDLKKTLTDVAYDEGYWGKGISHWLSALGQITHVNVTHEYKAGAKDGRNDGVRKARSRAAARSPNQSGSALLLKRQGLIPVDVLFGEALPHRRSLIMPGDSVEDQSGKLWLFVGTDENGKAILARDERELERLTRQIVQDRLHHTTAMDMPSASRVSTVFLNAEAYDCLQDYKAGGLTWQEYQDCLKRFEDEERGYRRPSGRIDTAQLEALDALLATRPNDSFIKSLRDQVARGRKLSDKQLKAVRQNLYRNRMKDKADLFRGASVSTVAGRFLEGNPDA